MATFYEETGTLVDEWNVDDVQQQRPDLNHEQACDVLEFISRKFDANIGISKSKGCLASVLLICRKLLWKLHG